MSPFCFQNTQSREIQPKVPKSFAQAISDVCDIPLSQLPQACVKGDRLAISITEKDYLANFDACKHNLHGRVIFPNGIELKFWVKIQNLFLIDFNFMNFGDF